MKRPARPAPPPKTAIATHLERVRTRAGIPSLRAFWQRLVEGWPENEEPVSYEAVRNYHYDRDPPPRYLARVAEVFDVRLEWLITGKGDIDDAAAAERAAQAREVQQFVQAIGEIGESKRNAERAFLEGFGYRFGVRNARLWADGARVWQYFRNKVADDADAARTVGRALAAPLRELGVYPVGISPWQLKHYVTLVAQALETVLVSSAEIEMREMIFPPQSEPNTQPEES